MGDLIDKLIIDTDIQEEILKGRNKWEWKDEQTYKEVEFFLDDRKETKLLKALVNKVKRTIDSRINYVFCWRFDRKSETPLMDYQKVYGTSFFICSINEDNNVSFIKGGKHHLRLLKKGVMYDASSFLSKRYSMIYILEDSVIDDETKTPKSENFDNVVVMFCRLKREFINLYKK